MAQAKLIACVASTILVASCGGSDVSKSGDASGVSAGNQTADSRSFHTFANYSKLDKNQKTGSVILLRGGNLSANLEQYAEYVSLVAEQDYGNAALYFISKYCAALKLDCDVEQFSVLEVVSDSLGFHHVRVGQTYKNTPVVNSQLIIHFNSNDNIESLNGSYAVGIEESDIRSSKSLNQLRESVLEIVDVGVDVSEGRYVFYLNRDGLVKHAAEFEARKSLVDRQLIYVDSHSGNVIDAVGVVRTGD